ncbi:MAG: homoserine dehydrogenase [Tissierellia bacterium]|nr:homoserine dehydrogenase [Tissierellia bacterium]
MKKITLALLGYGVVGKALEKLYIEEKPRALEKFKRLQGEELDFDLKWIYVRDIGRKVQSRAMVTNNYKDILEDEDVDIVVELMGGLEPATTMIRQAMSQGKSVVTANKYALYESKGELESLAVRNKVELSYEAAVAAGIPILDILRNRLFFEEIQEITGILNGSTNYILSRLAQGMGFKEALEKANDMGYLEADPSLDLQGFDSLHKIGILSNLVFGTYPKVIKREGIEKAAQIKTSNKLKLIARANIEGIQVGLEEVDRQSPFYSIDDGINAIEFKTKYTKELFFSGPGAGGEATALSVWADILSQGRSFFDKN